MGLFKFHKINKISWVFGKPFLSFYDNNPVQKENGKFQEEEKNK
jgi:hypothetical protein